MATKSNLNYINAICLINVNQQKNRTDKEKK